jgi:hypothetical protein
VSTAQALLSVESWLWAPGWSLSAVREPLAPIGKPCVIPAARLVAPWRQIGIGPDVLAVVAGEGPGGEDLVRQADQEDPRPPGPGRADRRGAVGRARLGSPEGIWPTVATALAASPKMADAAIAATTTSTGAALPDLVVAPFDRQAGLC